MTQLPEQAWRRRDGIDALLCALVGVLLCSMPHWIWLPKLGEPVWVADQDELYYLGVASQAYHDHPFWLGDPTRDGGHSLYQGLPLLPGIVIARLLGLGPIGISLVWRCWGGFWAGLGWYWVVRQYRVPSWMAGAVALLLLNDIGMLEFRPVARLGVVAWQVLSGRTGGLFETKPLVWPQWRVATPCLTMPYLLLFLGLHARARALPTWPRRIASGVGFGLLFYIYFYYWTAAALALAAAAAIDVGNRRASFDTAWIGGLLGIPALISSGLVKAATSKDWLLRTDKFLPIDRFEELRFPKPALLILAVTLFLAWRHRRDLILLWSLGASGLALMNHQLVTRLQIENFHWMYVCGPCLSLLIGLLAAGWLARSPRLRVALALVPVVILTLGAGLWLRAIEATRTKEVVALLEIYRAYDRRLSDPSSFRPAPHAVLAAEEITADWAGILERQRPLSNYWVMLSPSVTDEEWDLRIALNASLRGQERGAFLAEQAAALDGPGFHGPWGRDPALRRLRIESRAVGFDAVRADPGPYLDRSGLRYVMLPSGEAPPGAPGRWIEREHGTIWSIWERASSSAIAGFGRPSGRVAN